jgi:transcriptional regulator with XRE-family HTH domain
MQTQLKRIRRRQGFTASALADVLGLSESAVIHWQEGRSKPYPKNGRKLELLLGTPIEVLTSPENANGPDANAEAVTVETGSNYRDTEV